MDLSDEPLKIQVLDLSPLLAAIAMTSMVAEEDAKAVDMDAAPVKISGHDDAMAEQENLLGPKLLGTLQAQESELTAKELKHRNGECQPCAYFAFRADGCRQGDDCEFCHLCTRSQAKANAKKAKAARMKAAAEKES